MFVLSPLRRRPIALLWGGQVLSAIGDEIYRVALIWLAIDLVGEKAGYVGAVQAASLLVFGSLGGAYADRWNHRRTMIWVDVVRGLVCLAPPIYVLFHPLSIWLLLPVAVLVSSLGAFFDPALQASVPDLAREPELRQATTGLMDATKRIARILGPGLVAVLGRFMPLVQFFTLDAASFALSAGSVALLRADLPAHPRQAERRPRFGDAYRLLRTQPLLHYAFIGNGITWSTWSVGLALGLGILLHQRFPDRVSSYGAVLSAYGVGNLLANFIIGSIPIRKPARTMFWGLMLLGSAMIGMAYSPSLPMMMACAAIAAFGGPMDDLSQMMILQTAFRGTDIARLYRLLLTYASACMLAGFLVSPWLFRALPAAQVLAASGLAIFFVGGLGMARFARMDKPRRND